MVNKKIDEAVNRLVESPGVRLVKYSLDFIAPQLDPKGLVNSTSEALELQAEIRDLVERHIRPAINAMLVDRARKAGFSVDVVFGLKEVNRTYF